MPRRIRKAFNPENWGGSYFRNKPAMPAMPQMAQPQPQMPQMPQWMANGGIPGGIQQNGMPQGMVPQTPRVPTTPTTPRAIQNVLATPTMPTAPMAPVAPTAPRTYDRNITSSMLAPTKPIMFNGEPLSKFKKL